MHNSISKKKKKNTKNDYIIYVSTHIPNYCRTVAIAPTSSDPAPGYPAPTNTPNNRIIMWSKGFR